MLTKEDVLSWFKDLPGSKRVDLVCSLFTMCVPFELHFFSTVIEGLNKKDSKEFLDTEAKCNNIASLADFRSIMDDISRQKAVVGLALLHFNNIQCASYLYKLLTQQQSVNSMLCWLNQTSGNYELLSGILAELQLVYTLAANHPTFKYEEQSVFANILTDFSRYEQFSTDHSSTNEDYIASPLPVNQPYRNTDSHVVLEGDFMSSSEMLSDVVNSVSSIGLHSPEGQYESLKEVCDIAPQAYSSSSVDVKSSKLEHVPDSCLKPIGSPTSYFKDCCQVDHISLHRIIYRRTNAELHVRWTDGKVSLVRLSSSDLLKFHRKIETLVTTHDASSTHDTKHLPLPRFPGAGNRPMSGRVVLQNETLGPYFEHLMKSCPAKVLHSAEVANFFVRCTGRAQLHQQQESQKSVSPCILPEEESWERPECFERGNCKSSSKSGSTSPDEKPPVNTVVVFNSSIENQSRPPSSVELSCPKPAVAGIAPAIVRFGSHGVVVPRGHYPTHCSVTKTEDRQRLRSPIISPESEQIRSQASTPGLLMGSPLTSTPPSLPINSGNDSTSSDDSVGISSSGQQYLPKRLRDLFNKEKFRKIVPKLEHYSLSELRDLPDEQYEKYGLTKSSIDKLRRILCQINIGIPNGVCRPPSQNGLLPDPIDTNQIGLQSLTPEIPGIVQMEPAVSPIHEPIIHPLDQEGLHNSPVLPDGTPVQPFRSPLRPRTAALSAIRPPPARFGPIPMFGGCPRPVMNSRPVPWPPVGLPPPQKLVETPTRASTSGSDLSSPSQSMNSSPALSPASTPGPNSIKENDKAPERQTAPYPITSAPSQLGGTTRRPTRGVPPIPVQGRLAGIIPVSVNASSYPKIRTFHRRESGMPANPMHQKQPMCFVQFYPMPGVEPVSSSLQYVLPSYPVQSDHQSYLPILNPPPFYQGIMPVPSTIVPLVNSQNGFVPEIAYAVPPPVVALPKENTPPEQTTTPPVISCYNCGQPGHRGQDCGEATFDDIASQSRS